MGTTTIQVEKSTTEILKGLKKSWRSKTYDGVIQSLLKKKAKSMFGALSKGAKEPASKMLENLRDKRDRF